MAHVMTKVMTRRVLTASILGAAGTLSVGETLPSTSAADLLAQGTRALTEPTQGGAGLAMIVGVTLLSVAPALLMCITSFTRITIVLAFLRQGIGMPSVPPNQVLAALALFLTLFSMEPTLDAVWQKSVSPYVQGQLAAKEAAVAGLPIVREFMLRHTRPADLVLLTQLSGSKKPGSADDVRLPTLAAAFLLSELKTAFQIGLVILLPFLLIDLLVCVAISGLGLSGLSPATAALPLKLSLFIAVDGWNLIVGSLLRSFH